jgi:hypothetical protein
MRHRTFDTDHLQFPACHDKHIRRSQRRGLLERLASPVRRYPFRCTNCGYRFKRLI